LPIFEKSHQKLINLRTTALFYNFPPLYSSAADISAPCNRGITVIHCCHTIAESVSLCREKNTEIITEIFSPYSHLIELIELNSSHITSLPKTLRMSGFSYYLADFSASGNCAGKTSLQKKLGKVGRGEG
jgi:hypothetical protein